MPGSPLSTGETGEYLTILRRELHRHPSLSGHEEKTAALIERQFIPLKPDAVHRDLGGHGIAFEFRGPEPGKTVMFRADLDALPIREGGDLPWSSENDGISHKCGHDGHMAILTGLGERISGDRPQHGRAILLFQPEEETGTGAARIIADSRYPSLKPDYVFGLHNLPGFPARTIIIKEGTFAAASRGMVIRLTGKTAHAGQPETGISPARAIARLTDAVLDGFPAGSFHDFVLATIIHIRLGRVAFGTAPGEAEFMLTLRAYRNDDMSVLMKNMEDTALRIAADERLQAEITYTEVFPATVNDDEGFEILETAARRNGFMIRNLREPFRWSEDFGHYLEGSRGAFFGLGAGENHVALHDPAYDFPDEITGTGIDLFFALYRQLLKS